MLDKLTPIIEEAVLRDDTLQKRRHSRREQIEKLAQFEEELETVRAELDLVEPTEEELAQTSEQRTKIFALHTRIATATADLIKAIIIFDFDEQKENLWNPQPKEEPEPEAELKSAADIAKESQPDELETVKAELRNIAPLLSLEMRDELGCSPAKRAEWRWMFSTDESRILHRFERAALRYMALLGHRQKGIIGAVPLLPAIVQLFERTTYNPETGEEDEREREDDISIEGREVEVV
jgi:hypothetical protein